MRLALHCTVTIIRQFTLLSSEDYKIAWPPVVIDLDLDEHYIYTIYTFVCSREMCNAAKIWHELPKHLTLQNSQRCAGLNQAIKAKPDALEGSSTHSALEQ